jgi:hypothetical protein
MRPADTAPEAHEVQLEIYRRMEPNLARCAPSRSMSLAHLLVPAGNPPFT